MPPTTTRADGVVTRGRAPPQVESALHGVFEASGLPTALAGLELKTCSAGWEV